jgi:predicted nucleic acid-binding protein
MRTYIDTSVFGGYFDVEFEIPTKQFFNEIEKGIKIPMVSDLTVSELEKAPKQVKELYNKVFDKLQFLPIDKEMIDLANAYIKEKALTIKSMDDAIHIATATIHRIDVIVSWNFKHIVNLNRIRIFNAVNLKHGYPVMEIRTPLEVLSIKP